MPGVQKIRLGNVLIDLAKVAEMSPGQRLEIQHLLAEAEQLRAQNPLQFYRPASAKHLAFHASDDRLKAFQGGNRSGKTTTAIVDDLIQMTPLDLLPEHLHPFKQRDCPFYCRVMTPDMERTMKPVIHQKLKEWTPRALLRGGEWERSFDTRAQALRLECGCRFDFLSYEMALDKFGGAALHRCHYDEEPPEDIRWECLMRLVDFNGDELFSFTPLKGLTWAYRRIYKNRNQPGVTLIRVDTTDNPNLAAEGLERLSAGGALGLPDEQVEMRLHGNFTNELGFVYPEHEDWLVAAPDPRTVQGAEEILVGYDAGVRKAGLTATAHSGDAFLTFDAWDLKDGDVEDAVRDVHKRMAARWGLRPQQLSWIIDPNNAGARTLTTGESIEDELIRLGVIPERGGRDLDAGVMLLRRLGRKGHWKISQALTDFIESIAEYGYAEDSHGELHPEKTGREHRLDAVRYSITARAWDEEADELAPSDPWGGRVATVADEFARGPRPKQPRLSVAGDMV